MRTSGHWRLLGLVAAFALPSCSGTGGGDAGGPAPTPGIQNRSALSSVKFWAYQIQNQDTGAQALMDSRYDLLVIDQMRSLSGSAGFDDAAFVSKLQASPNHAGGHKIVLCYADVGEAENYRWYWQAGWTIGSPAWIVAKDPDGFGGSFVVKYWDPAWKAIIFGSPSSYVDRIIADGYDGIYLDWIEAYSFGPVAALAVGEGKDPALEMASFVKELADYARTKKPGFLVVGQNASALGSQPDYLSAVDGQAHEDLWFSGSASGPSGDVITPATDRQEWIQELNVFLAAGKPVFTVDYATLPADVATSYTQAAALGYAEYVTTVELGRLTSTPPPGY